MSKLPDARLESSTSSEGRTRMLERAASLYRAWHAAAVVGDKVVGSRCEKQMGALMKVLRREFPHYGEPPFFDPAAESRAELDTLSKGGGPLQPLRVEILRPLDAFNRAFVRTIEEWPSIIATPASERTFANQLRALMDQKARPPKGHRRGPSALAVLWAKRAMVSATEPAIRAHLAAQQEFQRKLVEALELLATGALLTHGSLSELKTQASLPHVQGPMVSAWFDAQRAFNASCVNALKWLSQGRTALDASWNTWRDTFERQQIADSFTRFSQLQDPPSISLVVHGGDVEGIEKTLQTIRSQPGRWEALLMNHDAGVRDSRVRRVTAESLTEHVSGDWVALIRGGDQLAPHALSELATFIDEHPDTSLLYADDDVLDGTTRNQPFLKPSWSPDLALDTDYLGDFAVLRKADFLRLARKTDLLGDSGVLQAALMLHEEGASIRHLPSIVVHRATARRDAPSSATVVEEHLRRTKQNASVELGADGARRVRFQVEGTPLISIIVPFRDKVRLLKQLLSTLSRHETYSRYELLLVSNNSTDPETEAYLDTLKDPRVTRLEWNRAFNYSALNNFAAKKAKGDFLLFLNNDIEIGAEGWLEALLGHAQRREIGAVGANLLYPDGTLQHAGVVLGLGGFAAHPFWRSRPDDGWTPYGLPSWTRNFLAVTGACVMIRKDVFDAVGGYDEDIVVSGSDVDLCLRIRERGLRVVNTPHVRLIHHESATRRANEIPDVDAWASFACFSRYLTAGDPFWNPNLSLTVPDCSLKTDPRSAIELASDLLVWGLKSSQTLGAAHATERA